MGVAAGDYDNNGTFDFFVTNFYLETNTLYHNEGEGFFPRPDDRRQIGQALAGVPGLGHGFLRLGSRRR